MRRPIVLPDEPTLGWLTTSQCTGSWVEPHTPVLAFWSAPPADQVVGTSIQKNGTGCGVRAEWVLGFQPAVAVPLIDEDALIGQAHAPRILATLRNQETP